MITEEINCKIAGIFQYPAGKEIVNNVGAGYRYSVESEPLNPFDANAIAIFGVKPIPLSIDYSKPPSLSMEQCKPVKLGYVPKAIAAMLKDKTILSVTRGAKFDEINITYE